METDPHTHDADLETALDFLNTLGYDRGVEVDRLVSTDNALSWLQNRGLMHAPDTGGEAPGGDAAAAATAPGEAGHGHHGDALIRRIRRTRDALRELTAATIERRAPDEGSVDEVNRALRFREVIQLVPAPSGLRLDHRHHGDPVDDALACLAEPIVREIGAGRPDRFRICASDDCRWVFFDDSPTARRRWCDMSTCGNRAKAARHRARLRADGPGTGAAPS